MRIVLASRPLRRPLMATAYLQAAERRPRSGRAKFNAGASVVGRLDYWL